VYLFATPKVHLRDYYVTTNFDNEYRDALLTIESEIANYTDANQSGLVVRINLFDKDRKSVLQNVVSKALSVKGKSIQKVTHTCQVLKPDRWTDETPNLYYLTLELIDADGKVVEVLSNRIGFKEIEVKHQVLLVNGIPVKLNGLNSHMQHPELGHTMDRATILKDFTLMKQFNINCVRTSHYPPTIEYLDIADEMGIFIVDETGLLKTTLIAKPVQK
jgi:beta-galactosidase